MIAAMVRPDEVLRDSRRIGLVDWPSPRLPATLVRAGFEVVSFNRLRNTAAAYSWYAREQDLPGIEGATVIAAGEELDGYLLIAPLPVAPTEVDILSVYRPPDEQPALARLAIELGAKALWVQPGSTSPEARSIAEAAGLLYVDDADIMETLNQLVE